MVRGPYPGYTGQIPGIPAVYPVYGPYTRYTGPIPGIRAQILDKRPIYRYTGPIPGIPGYGSFWTPKMTPAAWILTGIPFKAEKGPQNDPPQNDPYTGPRGSNMTQNRVPKMTLFEWYMAKTPDSRRPAPEGPQNRGPKKGSKMTPFWVIFGPLFGPPILTPCQLWSTRVRGFGHIPLKSDPKRGPKSDPFLAPGTGPRGSNMTQK